MGITHLYRKIRFAYFKKAVKNNPYIGIRDDEGSYAFKKGRYSISYRIIKTSGAKINIEWISYKYRLSSRQEGIERLKQKFFDFWNYQKWLIFLRPSVFIIFLVTIFIFYSEVLEPSEVKIARLKRIIAFVVGINTRDVQYLGNGWLEISGQRKTAVDRVNEPLKFTFNPFRWFFFSEGTFLRRWRGQHYGYVTNPVTYNDKGEVWINKEGSWRRGGKINDRAVEWQVPQGTGIRAGKVVGHKISTSENKLLISDIEK